MEQEQEQEQERKVTEALEAAMAALDLLLDGTQHQDEISFLADVWVKIEGALIQWRPWTAQRKRIADQKEEIAAQREEIADQKDEITTRITTAVYQRERIDSQAQAIASQRQRIADQRKEIAALHLSPPRRLGNHLPDDGYARLRDHAKIQPGADNEKEEIFRELMDLAKETESKNLKEKMQALAVKMGPASSSLGVCLANAELVSEEEGET